MNINPERRPQTDPGVSADEEVFDNQPTLTDGRLAVLLTEYAELGERIVERDRELDDGCEGTIPRSYSLAHYHSRQVEDLEGRRAEILQTLKNEGMPTGHWVGYGDRAALLAGSPPGYPEQLQLYDCRWESLEGTGEDATPLQIVRASRALEFRDSLSGLRRLLFDLYEHSLRSNVAESLVIAPVVMAVVIICTLASALLQPSAGVLVALAMVSGFGALAGVSAVATVCREQTGRMVDELGRREKGRIPEPAETVYVKGRQAQVEYPEPGTESPVGAGMLDVRFTADGSRGRAALADVKPSLGAASEPTGEDRRAGYRAQGRMCASGEAGMGANKQ